MTQLEELWNDGPALREILSDTMYAQKLYYAGPCFSGLDSNGTWLGAFGAYPFWKGVAELWMILDCKFQKHAKSFHKLFLNRLDLFPDMYGYHRMQTVVACEDPRAIRWIESMGFIREGKMIAYGPGREDYFRYAKVR